MNEEMIMKQKRKIGFSMGVFLIVIVIFRMFISYILARTNTSGENVVYIANAISIYILGYGTFKLMMKNIEKAPKKEEKKMKLTELLLLICIAIGVTRIIGAVTNILIKLTEIIFGFQINNQIEVFAQTGGFRFYIYAIIGAIIEEFIFRETLMEKLRIYGDKIAIIYTAIAFGLFHLNLYQIPFAIAVGLILGYAKVKTNNLAVPIIIHLTVNVLSIIQMIVLKYYIWSMVILLGLLVFICMVLALIFIPLKLSKKEVKIESESKYEKKNLYKNIGYIFFIIVAVILTIVGAIK